MKIKPKFKVGDKVVVLGCIEEYDTIEAIKIYIDSTGIYYSYTLDWIVGIFANDELELV